jgi:hypothetical protein
VLLEHAFNEGDLGQVDVEAADEPEDDVDLGDDLLAAVDGVVVGLVEVVGGGVEEFDEAVRGQLGDHLVGVLLRDVQLVVLHQCRPEQRHSTERFNINLPKSCRDYPPPPHTHSLTIAPNPRVT